MAANFNFNKVILGGRLTAKPELKQTTSGVMVVSFTLAVNRRYKGEGGEAQVDFINCTAWRQTAEFISKFFSKGSNICIVGNIQTRSYTDKNNEKRYVTEVVVDEASFVETKNDNGGTNTLPQTSAPYNANTRLTEGAPQFVTLDDDEEIPFKGGIKNGR